MKKIIYVVIVLLITMIVSLSIGGVLLAKDYKSPELNFKDIEQEEFIDVSDLNSISINMGYDKVIVSPTNNSKIYLKYSGKMKSTSDDFNASLNIKKDNIGKLSLDKRSYNTDNKIRIFNFEETYRSELVLEIFIPQDKLFDLNVKESLIKISDLKFNNLDVETYSRNIVLDNIGADLISLKTSSGDVFAKEIHSKDFSLVTYSGTVEFDSFEADDINLKLSSGDLVVDFKENSSNTNFNIKGYSSKVFVNNLNSKNFESDLTSGLINVKNSKIDRINSKGSSSDLSFISLLFKNAKITTVSGDINLNVLDLGDLNIETNSGDINLDLEEDVSFNLKFETNSGELSNTFPIILDPSSNTYSNYDVSGLIGNSSMAKDVFIQTSSGNLIIN